MTYHAQMICKTSRVRELYYYMTFYYSCLIGTHVTPSLKDQ